LKHDDTWIVEGDPMEGALLAFAGKSGLDTSEQRRQWTRTDLIPFDARHRFMATLNHDHEEHAAILVKGAPEAILALSHDQRAGERGTAPLDEAWWREQAERIAAHGQRVLALAVRPVACGHTVLEHDDVAGVLTFLGIVGLIDPPRPASTSTGSTTRARMRRCSIPTCSRAPVPSTSCGSSPRFRRAASRLQ